MTALEKLAKMNNTSGTSALDRLANLGMDNGGATAPSPSLNYLKNSLDTAKQEEQSAINAVNDYVSKNMGALDLQDPAILDGLRKTAEDATAKRVKLEQEYNATEGSYEQQFGNLSKFDKAAASVIAKPFLAADVAVETAKAAAKGEDINMNTLPMQKYGQMTQARQDITEGMGEVGTMLTNTGLSIADNLYSRLLLPGVPYGATVPMFVTAAADKMYDLGNQGESATRALVRGGVSGAIEGLTEALPLGTLADMIKTGGKGVVKNLLKQSGVEATEEGVSYAANFIADKIAKDPNAKWDWKEFRDSVVGGGLSGLFFGLGGTVIGNQNTKTPLTPPTSPVDAQTVVPPTTPMSEQKTAPNAVNGAETTPFVLPTKTTEPSKFNIDNTANAAYNNAENGGEQNDRAGSIGDYQSGVSGVYEGRGADDQGRNQRGTNAVHTGIILLSPESQSTLSQRGVVNVELHDSSADNAAFSFALDNARSADKANGWAVTPKSAEELNSVGVKTFMDANGATGFGIAPDGDIEAVFSNKTAGAPKGSTRSTIPQAIANGGTKLDCYGSNLVRLYSKHGFVPVARTTFNPEYANDGWTPDKGTPDIYFMMHNGESADSIVQNYGNYHIWTQSELDALPVMDYDDAYAYRDGLLTKQKGNTESVGAAPAGFDPYSNMIAEYGIIPEGENPSRIVDLPKSTNGKDKVSYTARTVMEAEATPDAMLGDIANAVLSGELSHEVNTDAGAMERARATVEDKGWDGAKETFHNSAKEGKVSKDTVALGQVLLNNAMNSGDAKATIDLLIDYSAMSTTAAQSLQAQRMLKKLTPEGQLYGIQRSVKNLQEELVEKYKEKAPNLQIPENLVKNFLNAKDQAERDAATTDIYKNIAQQVPATWADKWNAWRYMAMLANPRTHIRNIVGNAGFAPVRMVKDAIATTIEVAADKVLPSGINRTKAPLNIASESDRALISASFKDVKNVQSQLLGAGKYSDAGKGVIEDNRRIFALPPLEAVRKGNTAAMSAEDTWFSTPAYAGALAGYLKANSVTAESFANGNVDTSVLDKARSYAIKEAQKATYRDQNAFSDFISNLHYKGENKVAKAADALVEGVLPFRRTPANILMRGLEYSPAGLAKGLSYDLIQVARGRKTAAEAIDSISAGLTGTGLLALGAYLASQGLLSGGDTGDEEKDAMADLTGSQNYALSIGGQNYTLDWLAPEALPLFVGVELYNTISDNSNEGVTLDSVLSAAERITDPMLEMSMLSGVQDLIDTVQYAESGTLPKVIANSAVSYLTQAIPTIFGQIERSTESERETTFIDRTSGVPRDIQYTIGKAVNKLPFEFQQIPYIDAWGRTESTGSTGERIASNFLSPGYSSKENETNADKEINRLIEAGYTGVAPDRVSQSQKVDGEYMDAKEYVDYATTKGKTSYDIVTRMIRSDFYKGLDDTEKSEAIALAYTYANHVAAKKVNPKHEFKGEASTVKKAVDAGVPVHEFIAYYSNKSDYDSDNNGSYSTAENIAAIDATGMTGKERTAMFMITFPQWIESAEKRGVDFDNYVEYKVATVGASTKAEKINALKNAGYTVAEANRIYREMEQ